MTFTFSTGKKNKCLKKYCDCFGNGLNCGGSCLCKSCENMGDGDTPTPMVAKPTAKTTKKAVAGKPPSATKAPETLPVRGPAQCDYRPYPQCVAPVVEVTPEALSPSAGPVQAAFNPAAAVKHTSV